MAQGTSDQLRRIEAQLARQSQQLADQERRLAQQKALIDQQSAQLQALKVDQLQERQDDQLLSLRAGGAADGPIGAGPSTLLLAAGAGAPAGQVAPASDGLPGQPVGEAPPPERRIREVAAVPENMGVLTPRGRLTLDPSVEYTRSSANRLVFRGVEIVPGIQLGLIEANDADRDSAVATLAARYGLTSRLEIEARVPYVYRRDRVTTVAQRNDTQTRTLALEGSELGDVEVAARYQLNKGVDGRPIFVASGRIKPPTGRGPYDVNYDEAGVATSLATGSGFWAAEAGLTMLYPTDPAVIFAGLSYLRNFSRDIDKTIGSAVVGEVDPGDSIGASLGFGLALNPRFSFSLGYSHNYIFPTKSQVGATRQKSNSLQVGALQMGWSFRLNERLTLNNNFEFGVTSDAPDMRVVFRLPYRF